MWEKLGLIYSNQGIDSDGRTHASNPTVKVIDETTIEIFFSARDEHSRSSIYSKKFFLEGDNITGVNGSTSKILKFGDPGYFDDAGASMGCLLHHNNDEYLYYLGWSLTKNTPWHNSIGLAIRPQGSSKFEKYKNIPILDRNEYNPISLSYPWVIKEKNKFRMWHGSNLSWGEKQEDMAHCLKYAESDDGIKWYSKDLISVAFKDESEYAMSKPSVILENGLYKMWYSFRGKSYRIGYAESKDGFRFERKDNHVGITVSPSGWDSETIEYPNVFDLNGQRYMVYNGNKYGLTGFGLAKWVG